MFEELPERLSMELECVHWDRRDWGWGGSFRDRPPTSMQFTFMFGFSPAAHKTQESLFIICKSLVEDFYVSIHYQKSISKEKDTLERHKWVVHWSLFRKQNKYWYAVRRWRALSRTHLQYHSSTRFRWSTLAWGIHRKNNPVQLLLLALFTMYQSCIKLLLTQMKHPNTAASQGLLSGKTPAVRQSHKTSSIRHCDRPQPPFPNNASHFFCINSSFYCKVAMKPDKASTVSCLKSCRQQVEQLLCVCVAK